MRRGSKDAEETNTLQISVKLHVLRAYVVQKVSRRARKGATNAKKYRRATATLRSLRDTGFKGYESYLSSINDFLPNTEEQGLYNP